MQITGIQQSRNERKWISQNSFYHQKKEENRKNLHGIFLKPQDKVYRGASVLYFNAPFF